MAKAEEFRNQNVDELKALHLDLCKELYHLTNELRSAKKLEKPHMIGIKKKDIARVLTVLREKELSGEGNDND